VLERAIRKIISVELTRGDLSVLNDLLNWHEQSAKQEPETYEWSSLHSDLKRHIEDALAKFDDPLAET